MRDIAPWALGGHKRRNAGAIGRNAAPGATPALAPRALTPCMQDSHECLIPKRASCIAEIGIVFGENVLSLWKKVSGRG